MDGNKRELLVSRIISGRIALRLESGRFWLLPLSRKERYEAQLVYQEALQEAIAQNLFEDSEDLEGFLQAKKLWTKDEAKKLANIPKDIEKFKEALYENRLQSNKAQGIRDYLKAARRDFDALYAKRHAYDHLYAEGHATLTKGKFIVGKGLRTNSGKRVFRHESFWEDQSSLLDEAINAYASTRLRDTTLRELARTEPWNSFWAAKSAGEPIFGISSVDLTEEQASLLNWSILYENVKSHPDRPGDSVIEDDDMLDGWLIIQRKKMKSENLDRGVNDLVKNEKIRNSQHVFIPADTAEDASRINDFNDEKTKAIKAARDAKIKKDGHVTEWNMPDTKTEMQLKMNQMAMGIR